MADLLLEVCRELWTRAMSLWCFHRCAGWEEVTDAIPTHCCCALSSVCLLSCCCPSLLFTHGNVKKLVCWLLLNLSSWFVWDQRRLFHNTNEPVVISHGGCHIFRVTLELEEAPSRIKDKETDFICSDWEFVGRKIVSQVHNKCISKWKNKRM